ncbi:hypothetical protein GII30_22630 [Gordonia amarae]|uniref:Arabinosyltransferase AftB n=2 Tax=Gordonia amarae TaxID=36821 RepID=G7GLL1_9ACTN|nr:flagellar motor control protein ZomB [Gordonia amarae]MCS3876582.1 arabinofuranosyltransferase [Gordonia amarae]QHN19475.1 hypothetical protein GII35_23095 [Gordonia amarae]QHN23951.1 hypothetical protein GII34_22595 [Gordonia amarae]QHN32860.1 hypothetical protein GII32_22925 [Gordonia amarae]QHN41579.1 hypothetical protein GII30_22630 [Gordonia amarae]
MPSDEQPVGTESSLADLFGTDEKRRAGLSGRIRGLDARQWVTAGSFAIGAVAVTVFFTIGAWQRRWIADDGLIVLRTLRNLFAGNGPVFNAGERVEANTSTAWTYLLWFWAWVTDGKLEYVALWVALVLSVTAIPLAMYGTARLYADRLSRTSGWTLLLPLGAIVYIAVPPARDFATSGLENGLCIFWIAVLWCQFVAWGRRGTRGRGNSPATLALAFTAGLAPLIRPELAVLGGLVLLAMVLAPASWKLRAGIVVVAGVLPVGYQIFRMGYYALLVPNPAVAKDASGSKWAQGFDYVGNLFSPYLLVLPLILLIVVAALLGVDGRLSRGTAGAEESVLDAARPGVRDRLAGWSAWLQSPTAVTVTVAVAGAIGAVYWMRQGGDFMHGRVLLNPMFTLLLPLMTVPVTIPSSWAQLRGAAGAVPARRARIRLGSAVVLAAIWITTLVWGCLYQSTVLPNAGTSIGRSGIVDERRFYVTNMGIQNPVTAEDYLDYPRMRAMVQRIEEYRGQGGVILPSANYDEWYVAPLPESTPQNKRKVTVYFLNLGMTSMNAPLDVRVVDQMGLAYPLAAHTERLVDGRIGHDKNLRAEWVVAEAKAVSHKPELPSYLDEDAVAAAKVALTCPETKKRYRSYEGTWSWDRFVDNLKNAVTFNSYRIQREPEYEILRCGLTPPSTHR